VEKRVRREGNKRAQIDTIALMTDGESLKGWDFATRRETLVINNQSKVPFKMYRDTMNSWVLINLTTHLSNNAMRKGFLILRSQLLNPKWKK